MMHGARTALNRDPEMREWCEKYLKTKTREGKRDLSDEEFEQFWKYHKPEIVHAGAAEAVLAFRQRNNQN